MGARRRLVSVSLNNRIEPTAMSSRFAAYPQGAVAHPCRSAAPAMGWLGVRPAASRASREAIPQRWVFSTAGCRRAWLRLGAMQEVQPCETLAGVPDAWEQEALASCRAACRPVSRVAR